jgi:hypothetical protein
MFRNKQTESAPAPGPAAPLTPAEQLALAETALHNARNYCAKLDEEFRQFTSRRENANKIFQCALKRCVLAQEIAEKTFSGGTAEPVVQGDGFVLP